MARTIEKSHATEITGPSSRGNAFKEVACKGKSKNQALNCFNSFLIGRVFPMTCRFCCNFSMNSWFSLLANVVRGHCFCLSTVEKMSQATLLWILPSPWALTENWMIGKFICLCLSASKFIWFKNKSWDGGQLPFHANQCHGFNLIILVLWKLLLICCSIFSSFSAWPLDAPKSIWKLKGGGDGREMFIVNSTRIFRFHQCWLCNFKVSILKILSNWVHLKYEDSKEFYETKSIDSCSIFLRRYRHVSPCFMIILRTKPVGTRSRDFLSLLSKLILESAKRVDIGKCRLKGIGIMCLWNAVKVASLKSRYFDARYTHPPDKSHCPPALVVAF